jgi:hypothetical protein
MLNGESGIWEGSSYLKQPAEDPREHTPWILQAVILTANQGVVRLDVVRSGASRKLDGFERTRWIGTGISLGQSESLLFDFTTNISHIQNLFVPGQRCYVGTKTRKNSR